MSGKRYGVRITIGSGLVAVVVAITALDARLATLRIGPFVAAALGGVALAEYVRMAGLAAAAAGRAVLAAGFGALIVRALCGGATPGGLFAGVMTAVVAATLAAAVLSRRRAPVAPDDLDALARALLGVAVVVVPAYALIEIGFLRPAAYPERTCGFFSSEGAALSEVGVGPWLLLVTLFTSKLNDIGGYLVGSLVGRTPLAPGVSPKKSVEGAIAGLLLGTTFAWWSFNFFCPTAGVLDAPGAIVFGAVVSVATQCGDLAESLIKRAAGVKDSAALIPAFGGIFDLVDSFILAAPAGYTLLVWLAT